MNEARLTKMNKDMYIQKGQNTADQLPFTLSDEAEELVVEELSKLEIFEQFESFEVVQLYEMESKIEVVESVEENSYI